MRSRSASCEAKACRYCSERRPRLCVCLRGGLAGRSATQSRARSRGGSSHRASVRRRESTVSSEVKIARLAESDKALGHETSALDVLQDLAPVSVAFPARSEWRKSAAGPPSPKRFGEIADPIDLRTTEESWRCCPTYHLRSGRAMHAPCVPMGRSQTVRPPQARPVSPKQSGCQPHPD